MVGAQKHAVPFYERVGFKSLENGEYIENGRPRVYMIREKE
jgi:predicted GNAT family N-acyltransferase